MRHREQLSLCLKFQDTLPSGAHSTQKTERVKKDSYRDCANPRMSQLERKFERNRRDLNLPPGVPSPSPFFEGKAWRIGFQFQSIERISIRPSSLSSLGENEGIPGHRINPTPPPSPRKGDGHTGLKAAGLK